MVRVFGENTHPRAFSVKNMTEDDLHFTVNFQPTQTKVELGRPLKSHLHAALLLIAFDFSSFVLHGEHSVLVKYLLKKLTF